MSEAVFEDVLLNIFVKTRGKSIGKYLRRCQFYGKVTDPSLEKD